MSGRLYDHQVCVCVCACVVLRCARLKTEAEEGTPMWFTSEPSLRMSSLKTKIRRRKYALARGGGSSGSGPPPDVTDDNAEGCTKKVAEEWEFVNFNPVIYGRGRVLAQPPPPGENGCGLAPPPPLPPREPSPVMPPPRPPPFVSSPTATMVSTQDVAGRMSMRFRLGCCERKVYYSPRSWFVLRFIRRVFCRHELTSVRFVTNVVVGRLSLPAGEAPG